MAAEGGGLRRADPDHQGRGVIGVADTQLALGL